MPTAASVSVAALLLAIVLSCTTQLNVGIAAIALAFLVGVFGAGLSGEAVASGLPASLVLTLAGVTLLFSMSEANGTVEALARRALRLARGSARLVPLMFFAIAMGISSVGPGAVPSVALVVPVAMALGVRSGVAPLFVSLMVANGANAGNLSPLSAVGVIANSKMAGVGLGGHGLGVWAANFAAHAFVAGAAWLAFQARGASTADVSAAADADTAMPPLTTPQVVTLVVITAWIAGVVGLGLNVGLSAFCAAVVLIVTRIGDEAAAIKRMPWGTILMVSGVSVLLGVVEKTGGMDLFTRLLSSAATPGSINGVMAFLTGVISTYSSTSGVVLPTFLPTVPGLVAQVGGGDPLAVALSINVGSSLVDVSPLSTLGALCVASVADATVARDLFRKLLIWGLSMTVVGALLCQLFAGLFARL